MITPSYALTATERVLPSFTLDWTTGLVQSTVDVARAGVATFVGSDGFIQSALADTQRIDYSTGVAGLLVEESRTNINTYSDGSFVNGSNGYINSGTLVTTVNAPDGTATAEQFSYSSGVQQNLYKVISCSASTAYTWSFFYSVDTIPDSELLIAVRDDSNGAFIAANITPNKTVLANGWVRASYSFTTPVGCVLVRPYFVRNTFSVSGTIAWWGAQLEAGAFPTSYIPTTSSAVTRNADVATVTGTNFSDFYNEAEGSIYTESIQYNTSYVDNTLICIDDGTTGQANQVAFRVLTSGTSYYVTTRTAASQVSSLALGTTAAGTIAGVAHGYKLNSFVGAINGASVKTDGGGAVPPDQTRLRIGTRGDGAFINTMHLRKLLYWPQRLTNAEIQAFSKQG